MAVTTHDAETRSIAYSDAAVFGRVSNALGSYAQRILADAPAIEEQVEESNRTGLFARFRAYMSRRATAAELSRLSDATLADIGIARTDINRVAGL